MTPMDRKVLSIRITGTGSYKDQLARMVGCMLGGREVPGAVLIRGAAYVRVKLGYRRKPRGATESLFSVRKAKDKSQDGSLTMVFRLTGPVTKQLRLRLTTWAKDLLSALRQLRAVQAEESP